MRTIAHSRFIEKEGYWFNAEVDDDGKFWIVDTRRKRNQIDRDGLPILFSEDSFKTLNEAKKYLDSLEKI